MLRSDLVADECFDVADGPYCDNALWLRIAQRSDVGFLAEPLSGYRVHVGSASSGFRTMEKVRGRTVLTLQHAEALRQAHGRFVERPDLDPEWAAELRQLQHDSDRRLRLTIMITRWVPPALLSLLKRLVRWGRGSRLYARMSLYSSSDPSDSSAAAEPTPAGHAG
jgi:hypothetical protein